MSEQPTRGNGSDRIEESQTDQESGPLTHPSGAPVEGIKPRPLTGEQIDAILQENEILGTLLSNLPGMAYRSDPDANHTIEFTSDGCQELTGYGPAELTGSRVISYRQLIHPEDLELIWRGVEMAVQEKRPYDLVYRIFTKEGEEKWVRDLGRGVFKNDDVLLALEGFITDITDRKQAEKRILRQMQRFEALRKIDIAITASFDLRVTLEILLDQVSNQLGVDATDILLLNSASQTLEFSAGRGFRTKALQHTRLHVGESLAGRAALERRTVYISEPAILLDQLRRSANIADENFSTYYGVPLIVKGQVKGILEIFHRRQLEPDPEWVSFLEALAGQAAIAIDNATLFEDLQRSNIELSMAYDATLEGWSRALELRDQETEGHTQRVTEMALRLSQAMGVGTAEMAFIRRGALLHDIGKMGIPDRILLKPGPLSEEEWEIMRQHPVYAHKLLSAVSNLRAVLEIPYCHHEKWDGTGYPRGLKGEQIPLAGRIFAVVDVWDALISKRPYRPAWPERKVLEYIREQAGKHFDPVIVETFLNLVENHHSTSIN